MAKIITTKNKIDEMIESFRLENSDFIIRKYYQKENSNHWILDFLYKSENCSVDIYYRKNDINILPRGKNKDIANLFINFIKEHTLSSNVQSVNFSVKNRDNNFISNFCEYVSDVSNLEISVKNKKNHYIFESEEGDKLHLHLYSNGTILIQTKPYFVFNLLIDYFSKNELISEREIVEWNKKVLRLNYSNMKYVDELKTKLLDAYDFFPLAVRKTLDSSYVICKSNPELQDYSVSMAGIFRALEAYLKIVLQKFGYKLQKSNTFGMFHSNYKDGFKIKENNNIPEDIKEDLFHLQSLYSSKRNVYLHVPLNVEVTPIIQERTDMISIIDEILETIKISYDKIK